MTNPFPVPAALSELGDIYAAAGHELWLVGGCVRDHLMGVAPKDIDLATSATPDEQIALCEASGYRWFGTGLQHGTLTVMAGGEPYEITTFRTDVETDGRHATVEWTRDIASDLARRDLTINAIAMSFAGEIVDPFNGVQDAADRRVRFVGDAKTRIQEDHLRILRWFRFATRFGGNVASEPADLAAIVECAPLLANLSVERIWSEIQRIIVDPNALQPVKTMGVTGVLQSINVRAGNPEMMVRAASFSNDPAFVLAAWQPDDAAELLMSWKASVAEQDTAAFSVRRLGGSYDLAAVKLDLVDGADPALVSAILLTRGDAASADFVAGWPIPTFPLKGRDLLATGMQPGKAMGDRLKTLRAAWIASDFVLSGPDLIDLPA